MTSPLRNCLPPYVKVSACFHPASSKDVRCTVCGVWDVFAPVYGNTGRRVYQYDRVCGAPGGDGSVCAAASGVQGGFEQMYVGERELWCSCYCSVRPVNSNVRLPFILPLASVLLSHLTRIWYAKYGNHLRRKGQEGIAFRDIIDPERKCKRHRNLCKSGEYGVSKGFKQRHIY